jgi:hypothetical protein
MVGAFAWMRNVCIGAEAAVEQIPQHVRLRFKSGSSIGLLLTPAQRLQPESLGSSRPPQASLISGAIN